MSNAAQHSGADQVSTFVDVGEDEIAVFVRDRGSGFDPEALPAEAHGIAESIRGRMARAGGTASLTSSPRGNRGRVASGEAGMSRRRVVLVDDHDLFRAGVRSELGEAVDIVGEAGSVTEAVPLIRELDPDVVLLDVHLPDGGGHAVIAQVAPERPGVRFLALSVSDAAEDVIDVIRAGARGYVTKSISGADLIDAVKRTADGDAVFSPRLAGFVLDAFRSGAPPVDPELDVLTTREREVLQLIARGYRYKEIAARLHLSVKTVETHVSAVLRKLQLSNRHELTRWAAERRLICKTAVSDSSLTPPVRSVHVLLGPRRLDALRLAGHLRELRRVRRLALAGGLLALDPLEQDVQIADGVVDRGLDVAQLAKRSGIEASVKSSVSTSGSSSQVTGAETVASGRPRTEYAEAIVRSRAFWL